MATRFEIVRGDAGWFARFVAANGREIWRTSETYRRRAGAESDRAEYDAADEAEKRDWDRDRRVINVECAGLDQTCYGWVECRLPHDFTEDEQDEGKATAHGVWHQKFFFGWATEGDRCGLYQFPDAWCDAASDLADELGEGRHPIDFEWEDEYTILMHSAARVTSPEGGAR